MDDLLPALHASPWYGSLAITGGGSGAIARLLSIPGASGTVAEARVPYADAALKEYLGGAPDQACSASTARALAMTAFRRTLNLGMPSGQLPFGLGLTASLRSNERKRGDHRLHLALQTTEHTRTWSLVLNKGARSRSDEEALAADLALWALLNTAGLTCPGVDLLTGETIEHHEANGHRDWQLLILGEANAVAHPSGERASQQRQARLLFPGSFNPLHDGHRAMGRVAEQRTGLTVEFELCVNNADKAPLDFAAISERVHHFASTQTLWLTRAPTYIEKARLFPGCTFVIGIDTLVRIGETRFYADHGARDNALAEFSSLGCRFVVFGRKMGETFMNVDDVALPPSLRALCDEVPEHAFRSDLSSSAIRDLRTT